jgi:hypothetical protein
LFEIADRQVGHRFRFAVDLGVDPGHDAQQRRLARAVEPQDADLRTGEKAQRDVFEDLAFRRHDLADAVHRIDVLRSFNSTFTLAPAFDVISVLPSGSRE